LDRNSLRVRRKGYRHEVELEVGRDRSRSARGREFQSLGMNMKKLRSDILASAADGRRIVKSDDKCVEWAG
jgi:hypothetical protein